LEVTRMKVQVNDTLYAPAHHCAHVPYKRGRPHLPMLHTSGFCFFMV
jgi:hypothetical protein